MKSILTILLLSVASCWAQLTINLPSIVVASNDLPAVNFIYNRYVDNFVAVVTNGVGTNQIVTTNTLLSKKDFCSNQTTNWFYWNLQVNWWPEYSRNVEAKQNLKSFMEIYRQATDARQSNALAAALAILNQ